MHPALKPERIIANRLDALGDRVASSLAVQAVDLLTDEEIDELRALAAVPDDEQEEFVRERVTNCRLAGMYDQFADIGLVQGQSLDGSRFLYDGMSPKADWAIARHDRLAADRERREKAERRKWRLDKLITVLLALLGYIVGLATPYFTNLLYGA